MMVCDFAECLSVRLKKMWGFHVSVLFFSRTGQFMNTFAKISPFEHLIWSFVLPLFAWCKLSPKLHGCDFLSCNVLLHVLYIENTFSICVCCILWGDQTRKRVFLSLEILYSKVKRGQRRRCEDIKKKVSIFLLNYCCLFALLKAMNLFHLYKK